MKNRYTEQIGISIVGIIKEVNEDGIVKLRNETEDIYIKCVKNDIKNYKCEDEVKMSVIVKAFDDEISLFGFSNNDVKNLWKKLTSVSGIGNNGAFDIVDTLIAQGRTIRDICYEISTGNIGMIASVPGVGPKTAQRVIEELKDKIEVNSMDVSSETPNVVQAVEMLKSLGFMPSDIKKTLAEINDCNNMQTMDIVQTAIKKLQMI